MIQLELVKHVYPWRFEENMSESDSRFRPRVSNRAVSSDNWTSAIKVSQHGVHSKTDTSL